MTIVPSGFITVYELFGKSNFKPTSLDSENLVGYIIRASGLKISRIDIGSPRFFLLKAARKASLNLAGAYINKRGIEPVI